MSDQDVRQHRKPTLKEVDDFEMPVLLVPRLVKEHGFTEEYSKDILREAKRMLYLRAISDEGIVPSKKVDDAWHAMLMFTRSYQKFADFIGMFVHHEPTPPKGDQRHNEKVAKTGKMIYEQTKANYEKFFGEKPDPQYWP